MKIIIAIVLYLTSILAFHDQRLQNIHSCQHCLMKSTISGKTVSAMQTAQHLALYGAGHAHAIQIVAVTMANRKNV